MFQEQPCSEKWRKPETKFTIFPKRLLPGKRENPTTRTNPQSIEMSGMDTFPSMSRGPVRGLGALQAFIGLGAVGGGLGLILKPSGAILGLPLELLESSPFSTYLVPGIVLLAVNGLGSLAGAAATFARYRHAGEIAVDRRPQQEAGEICGLED